MAAAYTIRLSLPHRRCQPGGCQPVLGGNRRNQPLDSGSAQAAGAGPVCPRAVDGPSAFDSSQPPRGNVTASQTPGGTACRRLRPLICVREPDQEWPTITLTGTDGYVR